MLIILERNCRAQRVRSSERVNIESREMANSVIEVNVKYYRFAVLGSTGYFYSKIHPSDPIEH